MLHHTDNHSITRFGIYPIKDEGKINADREMRKECLLGILR